MYFKFVFTEASMPNELGKDIGSCVYYSDNKKLCSKNIEDELQFLGKFCRINLFVGVNNSGKSRFLRGLLKSENISIEISQTKENIEYLFINAEKWYTNNNSNIRNKSNQCHTDIYHAYSKLMSMKDGYSKLLTHSESYDNRLLELLGVREKYLEEIERIKQSSGPRVENRIQALTLSMDFFYIIENIRNELSYAVKNQPNKRIYIPILRSIKTSKSISDKIFQETVKELYDVNESEVFTGLDLFAEVLKIRNSIKETRKGFEEFEKFLSKHFFNKNDVEIISEFEGKHIIIYENGEERKIHNIGDGVQSIILLLFPIFTAEDNTWIFVEEPENYLHPGLQRIFIETLINDKFLVNKNLRYFFTTHSNHFLDLTLESSEISIFQFEKEEINKFIIKPNIKPSKETLDILGVNTSSVFLANASIWVEGPTDRKYLSKFLKLYCEHNKKQNLKEDIDFAFFEYGGNLIAHYLFDEKNDFEEDAELIREKIRSFALSNKIYLLADSDNPKTNSKKAQRRSTLEKLSYNQDNFMYQSTELIEIENLLPKTIIKRFIKELVNNGEIENTNKIDFDRASYANIGLGDFYKQELKKAKILVKNQRAFKSSTGTLKNEYKIKLCEFFIASEISYEELIMENKNLNNIIKKLYNFIKGK